MIISHKYRFIFVKTAKTAGTSIETHLSPLCGDDDVFTPFSVREPGHRPRNFRGTFDPEPEIEFAKLHGIKIGPKKLRETARHDRAKKFYHHVPAWRISLRAPECWESYFRFCIVRNPFEVFASGFRWRMVRRGGRADLESYIARLERLKKRKRNGYGQAPHNWHIYTSPATGEVMVDEIVRYETLVEGLAKIFERLGIEGPRKLAQNRKKLSQPFEPLQVTAAQLERVRRIYVEETEMLGYELPDGLFRVVPDTSA